MQELRARLVDTGVDLLAAEGLQALSLREIARRAGVSHGAPRRHFPTHVSLLSAVAARGFDDLGTRVARVVADDRRTARAQLAELGRIYVDFAATERGMFELMFRHDLLASNHLGLRETSLPLFRTLVDLVARARQDAGVRVPGSPEVLAGALWSNLHGIAQLWVWGSFQLTAGVDDVEPLLRAALGAHLGPDPDEEETCC
jgi:AcrR family transcriptional regulator